MEKKGEPDNPEVRYFFPGVYKVPYNTGVGSLSGFMGKNIKL